VFVVVAAVAAVAVLPARCLPAGRAAAQFIILFDLLRREQAAHLNSTSLRAIVSPVFDYGVNYRVKPPLD
jgi:hypothetical protein